VAERRIERYVRSVKSDIKNQETFCREEIDLGDVLRGMPYYNVTVITVFS